MLHTTTTEADSRKYQRAVAMWQPRRHRSAIIGLLQEVSVRSVYITLRSSPCFNGGQEMDENEREHSFYAWILALISPRVAGDVERTVQTKAVRNTHNPSISNPHSQPESAIKFPLPKHRSRHINKKSRTHSGQRQRKHPPFRTQSRRQLIQMRWTHFSTTPRIKMRRRRPTDGVSGVRR